MASDVDRAPSSFARVVRVPRAGSTNAELAAILRRGDPADGAWPHLGVLVADHQAAGRGRAGRGWVTPPGVALTASVVLRTDVPVERWPWLGLLGGLAVVRAVRARTGLPTALKWPNDVVLADVGARVEPGWGRDRKLAGVLAEIAAVPDAAPAAVLGFGVNVHQSAADLPVPWATSLAAAGVPAAARGRSPLLEAIGVRLAALEARWRSWGGDAVGAGLAEEVAAACGTLGREVRVLLPGGEEVVGRAVRLGADGSLVVRPRFGPPDVAVTAGDVAHVRTLRSD